MQCMSVLYLLVTKVLEGLLAPRVAQVSVPVPLQTSNRKVQGPLHSTQVGWGVHSDGTPADDECHPTPHRQCSQIISKGHFPHKPRAVPMKLLWEPKRKCLKATVPTHLQTHRVWSRAHTSQEPWPWKCESQKESVQRPPSHHTSKII